MLCAPVILITLGGKYELQGAAQSYPYTILSTYISDGLSRAIQDVSR
jgi:hypothetical protein